LLTGLPQIGPGTYDSGAALMLISRARRSDQLCIHPDARVRRGGHLALNNDRQLIASYAKRKAESTVDESCAGFKPRKRRVAALVVRATDRGPGTAKAFVATPAAPVKKARSLISLLTNT